MSKITGIISIVVLVLSAFPAFGLDIEPGKYEITTKVEMPGMPSSMAPQTTTQCLTKTDPVPDGSAGAQGCTVKDMKTKGNTVFYTMTCEQQGMQMTSTGEIVYKGNAFEGTTKMNMGAAAEGMTITTIINGKRIGKCDQ